MIVHIGSFGSGHYIAYGRSELTGAWFRFDDSRVTLVPEAEVRAADAYVLFYTKRVPSHESEWSERHATVALRDAAMATSGSKPELYYLPAEWWQRWSRLSVPPGAIDNSTLRCKHGQLRMWLAYGVPRVVWEQLRDKYGATGGALRSSRVAACMECEHTHSLRQHARAVGGVFLNRMLASNERHFLLPAPWVASFRDFIANDAAPSPPDGLDVYESVNASQAVDAVNQAFFDWAYKRFSFTGQPLSLSDRATFRRVYR